MMAALYRAAALGSSSLTTFPPSFSDLGCSNLSVPCRYHVDAGLQPVDSSRWTRQPVGGFHAEPAPPRPQARSGSWARDDGLAAQGTPGYLQTGATLLNAPLSKHAALCYVTPLTTTLSVNVAKQAARSEIVVRLLPPFICFLFPLCAVRSKSCKDLQKVAAPG